MISTLQSLQNKFKTDDAFRIQFNEDTGLNIRDAETIDALGSNLLDLYYRQLGRLMEQGHRRYPLYARVPFSEETFDINTETRVIKVPKDFQTNGVGVVGDHLAEVLWFRADRYYDLTDLMTTKISIIWHNTGNKAADLAYKTEPFALYCDDTNIYFGWWISQDAAAIAGNIEFAIQFVRTEEDESSGEYRIVFSLKTLPSKLSIKNGLELSLPVEEENVSSIVTHRAIYSEIVNTLAASEPILYKPLDQGKFDLDETTGRKVFVIRAGSPDNLVIHSKAKNNEGHWIDANGDEVENEIDAADVYTLTEANHNGEIQFKWYHNDIPIDANGANIKALIAGDGPAHLDLVTEPILIIETIDEDTAEDKICQSTLTTNIPGKYTAYVGNKVIKGSDKDAVRYIMTGTATLEAATPISVRKLTNPAYMYIEDDVALHTLVADLDWSGVNGVCSYAIKQDNVLGNEQTVLSTDFDKPITKVLEVPGVYQIEVYNTKNSMRQTDKSDVVTAIHAPSAINNIDCTYNAVNNTIDVVIDGGSLANNIKTYQCRATIQKAPGGTVKDFPLERTVNGSEFTVDLNNRGLEPGHYFFTIFAVEVTLPEEPVFTRYYRGADGKLGEEIETATFEITG